MSDPRHVNGSAAALTLFDLPEPAVAPAPGQGASPEVASGAGAEPGESTGLADALSPSQVRNFIDCGARWYYRSLLFLPDPPNSNLALGTATHEALAENFRQKIDTHQDLPTEGVVALFRDSWQRELKQACLREEEDPGEIGKTGEGLVRQFMEETAPTIQPAAVEQPLHGVIAGVRVNARLDLRDIAGAVVEIKTGAKTPTSIDPMHRFQIATYRRLDPKASGAAKIFTLVKNKKPVIEPQSFDVGSADIAATDTLYPLVQAAIRSGYYVPNRCSMMCSRRNCGFWRRCEADYGGVVEES